MAKLKLAILISGRGSNLQSLIEACQEADYPAEIVCVISNVPGVLGLTRAEQAGIPTRVIDHTKFADREAYEEALGTALDRCDTHLVCLAGFMRLLTGDFVRRLHDRIINIHPSLLPAFKGLNVHQRAIDSGVRFTGCTVHFVRPDMDSGPVIAQAVVPVHEEDDASSLAARILEQEHVIYPLAVKLVASGRAVVENERVRITDPLPPTSAMINPTPH